MSTAAARMALTAVSAVSPSIPKGYKQTDLGCIPVDWDVVRLGELGEPIIGLTYSPRDVASDGILVLRSSNIQDNRLDFHNNVFVRCEVGERLMVRPLDILVCVRNGSRDLIGKSVLLDDRCRGMTFGAFMSVYRSPANQFVAHFFQSDEFRHQVREHLGATINQITNSSLSSFKVALPPTLIERDIIAEALSDADALVESLEQLIAKKRAVKQGAMQELLSGERRLPGFKGEWKTTHLGSLGTFLKGSGVRKDEAQSGRLPCVRYGEIYTTHHDHIRAFTSWISPSVASTALRLRRGDVLFAGSGETKEEIGKCVAFLYEVEAYAGGDIVVLRPTQGNSEFLGHYLNAPMIARQKTTKGQGDAVVHISSGALGSIEVKLPPENEQEAIATVLMDMDCEIVALTSKLVKARQVKQGMMQELLTGRVRLV